MHVRYTHKRVAKPKLAFTASTARRFSQIRTAAYYSLRQHTETQAY